MSDYTSIDGQPITEAMIDRWCEAYERGEFPEGEHSTGKVIWGRPPLSTEGSSTISVKVPVGMKIAVQRAADRAGMSTSAYVRRVLADNLLVTA